MGVDQQISSESYLGKAMQTIKEAANNGRFYVYIYPPRHIYSDVLDRLGRLSYDITEVEIGVRISWY